MTAILLAAWRKSIGQPKGDKLDKTGFVAMRQVTVFMPAGKSAFLHVIF